MSPAYKFTAPGTFVNPRTVYKSMLVGNTAFVSGSYESIATTTVGSGGASQIDFTSIPSTYTHLQVRGIYLANNTDFSSVLRFNGSSTANDYSQHTLAGNGVATEAQNDASTNPTSMRIIYTQDVTSYPTAFVLDILDYANTNKNKTFRVLAGVDSNNTQGLRVTLSSGAWYQTSAINQVSIYSATGGYGSTLGSSFKQYSHFALYGIRSA